ncbi:VapE domain-containing protein [Enterococcus gilvus]|uniref:Virulence-associated protein E-like domain-containing protein n=1 Tax=Enterococcus gilvus ATCC BAA-350 TaxID=1158614 RepID=R2V6V2_9ENTE|nr:VapE domain-containing protein [Enterococcus gilvus]EOI53416.1 hypothetical protein UKC_03368 [Enterococcus gilvus ATCC BAA-350]EOW81309.1 hypothetical protein I592_00594 [Enterococcus gilvus ATCC BAA-350]OJG42727.1 hypothetical protein RV02_GL003195 [Enterococcus gilvus]
MIGKIAYNQFTYDVEITELIPLEYFSIEKGIAKNDLEPALLSYFEKYYQVLFPKGNVNDAIVNIANRQKYNPVKDYFEHCYKDWDEESRIAEFFPAYLGVEYSSLTTLITKLWLVGAVTKVYEPLAKFDFVLDLVGGQGSGKTTVLQKLGGQWYTDQITDFKDKDNFANMLRALIVNDDEMVATENSKFEEIKKFVTAQYLEFRKPFDRRAERYPKNFVIARTTNHIEYLKDKTGERRFLPLLTNPENQIYHPVTDLTQEYVDQLWGETVNLYKNGFTFTLSAEEAEELEDHRKNFQYQDDVEQAINTYLDIDIPRGFESWDRYDRQDYIQDMMQKGYSSKGNQDEKRERVTSTDIAWECFRKEITSDRKLANKIKYIFDNKKGWKKTRFRVNKISKDGYGKSN